MQYPGGKNGAGVYQKLINLTPPHSVYIEPFLGSGAVMRLKRPAGLNVGVDLVGSALSAVSADIAGTDERRRRESPELARADLLSLEVAAGPGPDRLAGPADARPRFDFHQGDGIDFLRRYPWAGGELIYCDPPYLMETRSSGRLYQFEFSDAQHLELLSLLVTLPCMVMVSGYWSSLYSERLQGWNSIHFDAMTRGGLATEWVWFNFPRPVALHDYRYLGEGFRAREGLQRKKRRWAMALSKMPVIERQVLTCSLLSDFRERERIKRKRERWTARINRMPLLEKQALLCAIADIAQNGGTVPE